MDIATAMYAGTFIAFAMLTCYCVGQCTGKAHEETPDLQVTVL